MMRREFCIGVRKVGQLYNVTFYRRIMRTERRRGDSDRGDQVVYFGVRAGAVDGPRVDGMVLQQALAGAAESVIAIAKVFEAE